MPRWSQLHSAQLYAEDNADADGANREVAAALEEAPDFADAHATLAAPWSPSIMWSAALLELEAAERFDPDFLVVAGAAAFDDPGADFFRVDFLVDALTRFGDSTVFSTVAVADAFVVIGPLLDLR